MTRLQRIATTIASVATSVGAVVAAVVNVAPSVHLPGADISILVAVSSVLATIVVEATQIASTKIQERKAAKALSA